MAFRIPITPPSASSPASDTDVELSWYGNIQYLLNISAIGAFCCVFIFLFVKLQSDHRRISGPSALLTKLLAVWHATAPQIAQKCGADAAQFLLVEGGSFALLFTVSFFALVVLLPVNLYAGSRPIVDQFSKTTINHISKGSPVLWVHFIFVVLVVIFAYYGFSSMEERLRVTWIRNGNGNPSNANINSVALFTVMVQGLPKSLAADKAPLEEYFQHRYPGRIYRVIVPMNLCSLDDSISEFIKLRNDISSLEARINSQEFSCGNEFEGLANATYMDDFLIRVRLLWRRLRDIWGLLCARVVSSDEDRLSRLQEKLLVLQSELRLYKDGLADGAGVAFVIFKDVYTTNKAVQDFRTETKRQTGKFFSVMELQLGRSGWRVERAPPASDIYWNHLGSGKLLLRLRRVGVNTCLLLMLVFCSSPLAIISAMKSAARIISAEALDNAQTWWAWMQSSTWIASVVLQFLPNVLIFMSMYIIIPSVLSYLSKFERHFTVSGEQRAALLKMVCFFLVNLIFLRALVESSLEGAIVRMGRCYLDGEDCKKIEHYMSPSFLSMSCLSSLAFLITSTFLGISYDLLAPVPWIKKKIQKFRKNDMLQLVPEQNEECQLQDQEEDTLHQPLIQEIGVNRGVLNESSVSRSDHPGQDLIVYPVSRSIHVPKQTFDFAQYYAFNLTIFALTMIYSAFAPLVVPVGAFYFGYRYVVDKYNFLFVYRVRGFPAGNDGKLMDRVLCIMKFCIVLFLFSMLLFFIVQGDSTKLQAIFTFGLMLMYNLLPVHSHGFQPSILESMQTVDCVVEGPVEYEVFSQPHIDWNAYQI